MTNKEKAFLLLEESNKGNFIVLTQSEFSVLKYIAGDNDENNYWSEILNSNWNRYKQEFLDTNNPD
jgi:hypothetical protein